MRAGKLGRKWAYLRGLTKEGGGGGAYLDKPIREEVAF